MKKSLKITYDGEQLSYNDALLKAGIDQLSERVAVVIRPFVAKLEEHNATLQIKLVNENKKVRILSVFSENTPDTLQSEIMSAIQIL